MEERKPANGPLSPSNTDSTRMSSNSAVPRHDNGHMMYRDLEAQGLAGTGDFVGKEQT